MDIINEVLTWLATLNWKWWTEGNNATAVGVIAGIVFAFIAAFWTLYTHIREKRHNPPVTPNNPTIPNVSDAAPGNSVNSVETEHQQYQWRKEWHAYVQEKQQQEGFDNFIDTQKLKLLPESGEAAFPHLHWAGDISGRDSEHEAQRDTGKWQEIGREDILERMEHDYGQKRQLHRVVVTADAGVGKTSNLKWFWKALNKDNTLALYMEASELPSVQPQEGNEQFLLAWYKALADGCKTKLRQHTGTGLQEQEVYDLFEHCANNGELVLIIDGLDQKLNEQSLKSLADFLKSNTKIRALLGGRRHSIHSYKDSLDLKDPSWRFIRICEFEKIEQNRYLGDQLLKSCKENGKEQVTVLGEDILSLIAQDDNLEAMRDDEKRDYYGKLIIRLIRKDDKLYDEYFKSQNPDLNLPHKLTRDKQIEYLGKQRLKNIPEDAKPILFVPRVLEMLAELTADGLKEIHTKCDIFHRATKRLVAKSFQNSTLKSINLIEAKTNDENLHYLHALLGAIAYTMTSKTVRLKHEEEFHNLNEQAPCFDPITKFNEVERLKEEVIKRITTIKSYSKLSSDEINQHFNKLYALGTILEHPKFETDSAGISTQMAWTNQSFQEYYTAYWLANYASEEESEHFKGWVFFHEILTSHWFMEINRFLAEMPEDALVTDVWVRSAANWYLPNSHERSSEMIFRSWKQMHKMAGLIVVDWWNKAYETLYSESPYISNDTIILGEERPARDVLEAYWNEFQGILNNPESNGHDIAKSFVANRDWAKIPAGSFNMGSSDQHQGFPTKTKAYWDEKIEEVFQKKKQLSGEELKKAIRAIAESCVQSEWYCGVQGKKLREEDIENLRDFFLLATSNNATPNDALNAIEKRYRTRDETPVERSQDIKAFEIHTLPVLNKTFRLFYPKHDYAQRLSLANFKEKEVYKYEAPKSDHPVNFVSWYDSWAFCQWAQWREPGTELSYRCRLPHEPEWEFAAKGCTEKDGDSFPENQRYWWGNDFYEHEDPDDPLKKVSEPEDIYNAKAYAVGSIENSTRATESAEPNKFGLKDVLGNVWEWMANPYREKYSRKWPDPGSPNTIAINCERTMRGGLWYFLNLLSTITQRFRLVCNDRDYKMGFRVIREEVKKDN